MGRKMGGGAPNLVVMSNIVADCDFFSLKWKFLLVILKAGKQQEREIRYERTDR